MQYLSSYTIYNEVIEGMRANGASMDALALELDMTQDELAAMLTPTHDYTISEIKDLLVEGESLQGRIYQKADI